MAVKAIPFLFSLFFMMSSAIPKRVQSKYTNADIENNFGGICGKNFSIGKT